MNNKVPTYEEFSNYTGLHCHKLWREVGHDYICPACKRNKFQLLRWTTRAPNTPIAFKDWVAELHHHHDHSQGFMNRNFGRFPVTIVCGQCNKADGIAKRQLKLPSDFSFSPAEINRFIKATPHGKHSIDIEIAGAIYSALKS